MTDNLNPAMRIIVSARTACALDRFYRKCHLRKARPFRRARGQRQLPAGAPQELITDAFSLGAAQLRSKPGESIDQTLFRLAGGIR